MGVDRGSIQEPRSLSATKLASASIRLAVTNYWALLRATSLVLVPTFVIGGIALGYWRGHQAVTLKATGPARSAEFVAVGVIILGNLFAQAAGIHAAASAAVGGAVDWRRSIRAAAERAGSVFGVGVSVAVLSGIGLFFFVIPGVFLWISFVVAIPAVVLERRGIGDALRRSMVLVRGSWWRVLGAYLLIELFLLVCTLPVDAVAAPLARSSSSTQAIADQVTSAFVEIALIPVVVAFVALVYFDLRFREEGVAPIEVLREAGVESPRPPSDEAWGRSETERPIPPTDREASTRAESPPGPPGWPAVSPKPRDPGTPPRPSDGATHDGERGKEASS